MLEIEWLELVLLVLASYRLTHLLVYDRIAEPVRRWVAPWRTLSEVLGCHWCTGVWVSAGLLLLWLGWPSVWSERLLLLLAIAGGQGLLESLARR